VEVTARDDLRLVGVHPTLIGKLQQVFHEHEAKHTPLFVVEGVRTQTRQAERYARGRTTLGPIVTNCDGVAHPSPHQPHADGYGYAVDVAFVDAQPFDLAHDWEGLGRSAEAHGLIWGWRFSHPVDLDHLELPIHKDLIA
jgi:peptidoglycan L-alanyl-D-glutamate endopeptidase CwlK